MRMENEEEQTNEENKQDVEQPNDIATAKETLARLEEQNKIMSANLDRAEKLKAADLLGGGGNAGQVPKTETKDEKIEREAKEILASAGVEL